MAERHDKRGPALGVELRCFPSSDSVFARFVAEAASTGGEPGRPAELQRRLRSVYPRATVTARSSIAGFGETLWYVYRDGRPPRATDESWWTRPGVGEGVFDEAGVYVSANDPLCALHGVPPGGMAGRRWDEFATPESKGEADALWRRMIDAGWPASGAPIESTFTLVAADGTPRDVEYRTEPQPDGTFRTWMRPLDQPDARRGG